MEREYLPNFGNKKEKLIALDRLIKASITKKLIAEVEAMSQEDKLGDHYLSITPEIPKTKKGIEKAIDTFINDFSPLEDNGEELLSYLGFYDNEAPHNEKPIYIALRSKIESKEAGDEIEILTETKEVINIVRDTLRGLGGEELYNLWIFGITVTEEEAKENVKLWVERKASNVLYSLLFYAMGSYAEIMYKEPPEDAITYSAKETYRLNRQVFTTIYPNDIEEPEKLSEYKERVEQNLKGYPKEAEAYCRGWVMAKSNYSERAIIATINTILNNEQ
jgi:hypothetical protein